VLVNRPSLEELQWVHDLMGLPEPLVYVHLDSAAPVGMISGWIYKDQGQAWVEHMIVLPYADHKFRVMMAMSRECTRLLHERGLDVVLKILKSDPRTGLHAWAKRMKYLPYTEDHDSTWFISRREDIPADGQEQAAVSEGSAAAA
jgi:hypothetical protein